MPAPTMVILRVSWMRMIVLRGAACPVAEVVEQCEAVLEAIVQRYRGNPDDVGFAPVGDNAVRLEVTECPPALFATRCTY